MEKPWIGIPARYHEKSESIGQIRHYLDAILWAGGLPLMIPATTDREMIGAYIRRCDGVLLPGSATDIDPARYGAPRHEKLGKAYPERDATDFAILDLLEARPEVPVLGICFGIQSLNVHRGGSLIQDIPALVPGAAAHDDSNERPARHFIQISEHTLLARLAGTSTLQVNSYHHQAIERTGRDLRAAAVAEDGVIEAVEDVNGRFIVGVQWHPERGWSDDPFSKALFSAFIERAALRYNQ